MAGLVERAPAGEVFAAEFGAALGSSFTIEVDNRQYLITARHVLRTLGHKRTVQILQDGAKNPGFSGGPVVRMQNPSKPAIVGVVSAYKAAQERVFKDDIDTGLTAQGNSGLLLAFPLKYAPEAIQRGQNGGKLSSLSPHP